MGLFWFILGSLLWHLPVVVDDICVVGLLFGLEHNAHYFILKGSRAGRENLWRRLEGEDDISHCITGVI